MYLLKSCSLLGRMIFILCASCLITSLGFFDGWKYLIIKILNEYLLYEVCSGCDTRPTSPTKAISNSVSNLSDIVVAIPGVGNVSEKAQDADMIEYFSHCGRA